MELMWEPRKKALEKITKMDKEPEMSEFESAFLCGLIKEQKPKKILEIGVAAGGTTAIIMQCLSDLKMDESEFISCDLNEMFYRDLSKKTGFLGEEIKVSLPFVNHRFILGHVIAEVIDEIGDNIDFVILDTVHSLPGEVLDFPVLLPYLSNNATVVLHDVAYHHYFVKDGIATQVLFDSATGEKIIPIGLDEMQTTTMPNIAAVRINNDSEKYIDSVFYAMLLPWQYMPDDNQLKAYRDFYTRHYGEKLVKIFDTAVEVNMYSFNKYMKNLKRRLILAIRMITKGF